MMRKFWWTAVGVVALAGCGDQGGGAAAPDAAPVTPPSVQEGAPTPTPTPTPDATPKPDEPKVDAPKPDEPKPDAAPKPEEPKPDAPKGEASASAALGADEIAQIKNLPEADQPIALAQITCPVSGEKLGEMGVPLKVTADGQSFFLCCKGCKKEVDKDPAAVLAKLKKN